MDEDSWYNLLNYVRTIVDIVDGEIKILDSVDEGKNADAIKDLGETIKKLGENLKKFR